MKSVATVAAIADPKERLREASKIVRDADTKAEEYRALRDMATIIAHVDHDMTPVTLYRDILGVSRGLFNRMIQRTPSDEERAAIVAANPTKFADPAGTAKKAQAQVVKYEAVSDEARAIRDATAAMLMNGEDEDGNPITPVSNADIARITGLTTARVAQMRTGHVSRSKRRRVAVA